MGVGWSGCGTEWVWDGVGVGRSGCGMEWVWDGVGVGRSGCGMEWVWDVWDGVAYHLHLILCTPSAATACTPVTHFFPLGVQLCSLHPKWEGKNYSMNE